VPDVIAVLIRRHARIDGSTPPGPATLGESIRLPACIPAGMRLALLLLIGSIALARDPVVVRSIKFADFQEVSTTEILDRLNEREVRLEVEKPYRPEDAMEARHYIAQLLAEKGRPDARIEIDTKVVARHQVEVQFRLVK
jgi:hypothetical protein